MGNKIIKANIFQFTRPSWIKVIDKARSIYVFGIWIFCYHCLQFRMIFLHSFPFVRHIGTNPLHCGRFLVQVINQEYVTCFVKTYLSRSYASHTELKETFVYTVTIAYVIPYILYVTFLCFCNISTDIFSQC